MKKHTKKHAFLMGLFACLLYITAAQAQTQTNDLTVLQGYRSYGVSSAFAEALRKENSLYTLLQQNPEFSTKVLNNATLQREILQDIRKTGSVEAVVRSYLSGLNGTDLKQAQKEEKEPRFTHQALPQQQATAYQQQQQQNNATQRAQNVINQALVTNQQQQRNVQQQLDRTAQLTKLLEDHPQILSALLQDQELLQKVLDQDLSLEQILAEFGGSLPPTQITHQLTNLPEGVFDVNTAPLPAEVTLAANGWPTYLNVPAICPPPENDLYYRLESSGGNAPFQLPDVGRLGPDKGADMLSNHNVVRSHFNRNGNWWVVNLTEKEVLAAPFAADNQETAGFLNAAYEFVTAAGFQVAISYCPGDFRGRITPPGRPQLSEKCAVLNKADIRLNYEVRHKDRPTTVDNVCVLAPSERYFLNYRLQDADPFLANSPILCATTAAASNQPFPQRNIGGQTLPVCALQFAHTGNMHATSAYVPYAGPCLAEAPFPPNYNALTCGRSQPIARTQGAPQGCNSTAAYKGMNKTCYDPANQLPPQRFVHSCSPDGSTLTWLEGYNEAAYNIYVCEDTGRDGSTLAQTGYPAHRGVDVVCAAHRDGEIRTLSCPNAGPVRGHKEVQQCQFDATRNRYDWAKVDITPGAQGNRCTYSAHNQAPAYRNVCIYQGADYSLNTQAMVTCSPGANTIGNTYTAKMVCQQRAQEPALPTFVITEGYIPTNLSNHVCRVTTQRG